MRGKLPAALALLAASTAPAACATVSEPIDTAASCSAADRTHVPERISLADLRQRFEKPGDQYVDVGGVELRYRDEGEGPVLLLLHGSRSTLNAWDGVAAHLAGQYRIVRFDMPPTGLSGPLTDEAIAAVGSPEGLVAGFLDALGIEKASVMGVSSGGTMGYYFAASYPDRVENLILTNTPSNAVPGLKPETPPALDAAYVRAGEVGVEGLDFWCEYLGSLWGDQSRLSYDFVRYYYETNLREDEANPRGLHALTANIDTTMARLDAVKAPVLIMWGMRDYVLLPNQGRDLESYLKNASSRSFVELESVGHYPPMESPEAVADLADAFIHRNR
nr:alpha/beta hydrolase [Croceicoccus gelatinilyticus]